MSSPEIAETVAYHSRIAAKFHRSYQTTANRLERLRVWRRFIDRYSRNAALAYDLGCGSGILACEVAKRGIETIGIDGSESMLELAALTAAQERISNISFARRLLPLENPQMFRQADLVIVSSVLEYLPSMLDALQNFQQLLRSDGVIIFSVANRDSVSRRLDRASHKLTRFPQYLPLVRNISTIEEVSHVIYSVGLELVEYEYCEGSEGVNKILRYLLPVKYANGMIIVVASRPLS